MKKVILIVAGIIIILFSSCKKDNNDDDSTYVPPDYVAALEGKWENTNVDDDVEYLIFTANNDYYWLTRNDFNLKSIRSGFFMVDQYFITSNDYVFGMVKYKLNGDQLTLTYPNNDTMQFVKNDSLPEADEWIVPVSKVHQAPAPVPDGLDICYGLGYIWHANGYESDYIYKISPSNLQATDSTFISKSAWAIEFYSSSTDDFYIVSNNGYDKVYYLLYSNGAQVLTSVAMGSWIKGIAFDGTNIWCASTGDNTLYEMTYDGQVNLSKTEIGVDIEGMTYKDGYLYVSVDGYIHKCQPSPFEVIESYELENEYVYGITNDGTLFWVTARNKNSGEYNIHKIEF